MSFIGTLSDGWGQEFTIGLVSDGDPKPNAKVAYDWAKANFNAKILSPPRTQKELTEFGVVWWDESHGAAIPALFTEKAVIEAFLSYAEAGGGLLLSNLAFHYVKEMGVESGEPRYFGANANSPLDWTDIHIAKGQEQHPIFQGLKIDKGAIQYDIQGWTEGSDFCVGPNGPKDGTLLAQVADGHPQCNPLVEYEVGDGRIIIIGWVWSSWGVNQKLLDTHAALHANILNYLASQSKFAPVEASGKLAATWGALKVKEASRR
jgi:hypothetical protein